MNKKIIIFFTAVLILFIGGGCQEAKAPAAPDTTGTTVSIPSSGDHVPTIDGSISPEEWQAARRESFADGSELFLMHNESTLFLGIRASTPGMIGANVFVERGDEIDILHVSAALGTAIYEKVAENWQQRQDFSWRCRDTGSSDTAQAERDTFLQQEHWVAANSRMGNPEELEYQIELRGNTLHLAVAFLRASNPNEKLPWPVHLNDDCILSTPGDLPTNLSFTPEQWATITLTPGGEMELLLANP